MTVQYATVDGTATVANNDYQAVAGTLTFTSTGPTLQTVTVLVNGDTTFEPNEVFTLHLFNATNALILEDDGVGLVYNDDLEPGFSVGDVSANEGNAGTTPFTVTFTRSGNPTVFSSMLVYSTAAGTATSPADFAAVTIGSVTFAPNETTKTAVISVVGDTVVEPNETFTVNIVSVTNGLIADGSGSGHDRQ